MTNSNLTEIVCIIDRSGSMDAIRSDAIGGFNSFLKEQKAVGTPCKFTYAQFDDVYELVYNGINIQGMPCLTEETFVPRGMTALYDAIGRTINAVGERLAQSPEHMRPGKVLFVILTDGHENASKEFSRDKIFSMISTQRNEFSWEFIFLAANMDAHEVGKTLGTQHAATFTPDRMHTNKIFARASSATKGFRGAENVGEAQEVLAACLTDAVASNDSTGDQDDG